MFGVVENATDFQIYKLTYLIKKLKAHIKEKCVYIKCTSLQSFLAQFNSLSTSKIALWKCRYIQETHVCRRPRGLELITLPRGWRNE